MQTVCLLQYALLAGGEGFPSMDAGSACVRLKSAASGSVLCVAAPGISGTSSAGALGSASSVRGSRGPAALGAPSLVIPERLKAMTDADGFVTLSHVLSLCRERSAAAAPSVASPAASAAPAAAASGPPALPGMPLALGPHGAHAAAAASSYSVGVADPRALYGSTSGHLPGGSSAPAAAASTHLPMLAAGVADPRRLGASPTLVPHSAALVSPPGFPAAGSPSASLVAQQQQQQARYEPPHVRTAIRYIANCPSLRAAKLGSSRVRVAPRHPFAPLVLRLALARLAAAAGHDSRRCTAGSDCEACLMRVVCRSWVLGTRPLERVVDPLVLCMLLDHGTPGPAAAAPGEYARLFAGLDATGETECAAAMGPAVAVPASGTPSKRTHASAFGEPQAAPPAGTGVDGAVDGAGVPPDAKRRRVDDCANDESTGFVFDEPAVATAAAATSVASAAGSVDAAAATPSAGVQGHPRLLTTIADLSAWAIATHQRLSSSDGGAAARTAHPLASVAGGAAADGGVGLLQPCLAVRAVTRAASASEAAYKAVVNMRVVQFQGTAASATGSAAAADESSGAAAASTGKDDVDAAMRSARTRIVTHLLMSATAGDVVVVDVLAIAAAAEADKRAFYAVAAGPRAHLCAATVAMTDDDLARASALSPLAALFLDPSIVKVSRMRMCQRVPRHADVRTTSCLVARCRALLQVVHDGREDIVWLQRHFGLFFVNVLDTGVLLDELALANGGAAAFRISHEARRVGDVSAVVRGPLELLACDHTARFSTAAAAASMSEAMPASARSTLAALDRPLAGATAVGVGVAASLDLLVEAVGGHLDAAAWLWSVCNVVDGAGVQRAAVAAGVLRSHLQCLLAPPHDAFHGDSLMMPMLVAPWYVRCSSCGASGHFEIACPDR